MLRAIVLNLALVRRKIPSERLPLDFTSVDGRARSGCLRRATQIIKPQVLRPFQLRCLFAFRCFTGSQHLLAFLPCCSTLVVQGGIILLDNSERAQYRDAVNAMPAHWRSVRCLQSLSAIDFLPAFMLPQWLALRICNFSFDSLSCLPVCWACFAGVV